MGGVLGCSERALEVRNIQNVTYGRGGEDFGIRQVLEGDYVRSDGLCDDSSDPLAVNLSGVLNK